MSVIACGGYIFAVGGFDGTQTLNSVECYNPVTNRYDLYNQIFTFLLSTLNYRIVPWYFS